MPKLVTNNQKKLTMKAVIESVTFHKEVTTKFGVMYSFKVCYSNGRIGSYLSKTKEQTYFVKDQESEFNEEEKLYNGQVYYNLTPIKQNKQSNYSRQVKKEQSRYSGFAVSYTKDLIIAGKLDLKDWEKTSEKIFNFMVKLDKTLE